MNWTVRARRTLTDRAESDRRKTDDMKILVTGANGQLGMELRNIARNVAAGAHTFVFTDVNSVEGEETVRLDITDAEAVKDMAAGIGADVIVNCAAYTTVDRAEDDVLAADLLNRAAPGNLAAAARDCGAALIHVSTDYVFDGEGCVPYTEDREPKPVSVYGRTKLEGERAVTASGCRHIILRTAWLYSPYGKNFMKTMLRLTSEKEELNVVSDQVGSPTSAADLADAIFRIIDGNMLDRQGIYHYSNEGVCSWYDFALAIRDIAGNGPGGASGRCCRIMPCHSDEFPSKVKRPHYSVLDKSLFKRTFGLEVPYWLDSLKACMERVLS